MRNQYIDILLVGSLGIGQDLFNSIISDSVMVWAAPRWRHPREINIFRQRQGENALYSLPTPYSPFMGTQVRDVDGFCLLVNSCDERAIYEARGIVTYMTLLDPIPYIIVATNQNHQNAFSIESIRDSMDLPDDVIIMPCEISERGVVEFALKTLRYEINSHYGISW